MSDGIHKIDFTTEYTTILNKIKKIDPVLYGTSRNYIDGAVSYLSPYISRGVISTKFIYQELQKRSIEKYLDV